MKTAQLLQDKVVVVIGGAGLLGRAFASGICRRGGTVVVTGTDLARAQQVAEELAVTHPGRASAKHLDITDTDSVRVLITEVSSTLGRLDGVVNSAWPRNASFGSSVETVTYADFCENVDWQLGGYFLVTQKFAEHFRETGGGSIVNMGSIYGTLAPRFEVYGDTQMTLAVEYAAIKSGVIQLTRYFAKYYRRYAVRVNCISPGGILNGQEEEFVTRYNELAGTKGMLSPEDTVGAVAFMLSDESRYVTGQNLIVDDGFSL